MLKIRRPLGRLIFNMGIAIPGKTVFLIETAPWLQQWVARGASAQRHVIMSPSYKISSCIKWADRFTRIFHDNFTGIGEITWLPQCQWRTPEIMGRTWRWMKHVLKMLPNQNQPMQNNTMCIFHWINSTSTIVTCTNTVNRITISVVVSKRFLAGNVFSSIIFTRENATAPRSPPYAWKISVK